MRRETWPRAAAVGWTRLALLLLVPLATVPAASAEAHELGSACETSGLWLDPRTGHTVAPDRLLSALAGRRSVLLGESHLAAEHHRWQLHALAGLHAHRPSLVIGFEMFPRSVQSVLNSWSAGELSEADFLEASRWAEVWGYDADLYLPLFHFARQNRLPMVALNVDRRLVSRVADDGWSAIPEDDREGITDPAPASEDYRRSLVEVYLAKQALWESEGSPHEGPPAEEATPAPDRSEVLASQAFERFVEAQLTWDRAMAQALVQARAAYPDALVVGIIGRGHLEHGHGVPHQLSDLGEEQVAVLLPVERGAACAALEPDVADAVFLVEPIEPDGPVPPRPRLGIRVEQVEGGVRVLKVEKGSVAEATDLREGDVIVAAAATPTLYVAELIRIVQRQAPGTWLPLGVERGEETLELIARFPPRLE
jgi:uncharacterized iron-regulated protein